MTRSKRDICGCLLWRPRTVANDLNFTFFKKVFSLLFVAGLLGAPTSRRCRRQRGAAALEFALVMPTVIALFCGIATFGAALYAKQLLYDMAGETGRACALKSFGSRDDISSCVKNTGSFLSSSSVHSQICLGSTVSFNSSIKPDSAGVQTAVPTNFAYPQEILFLEVTASCNWSFAPGFAGLFGGMKAPSSLSAKASVPLLFDTSPL